MRAIHDRHASRGNVDAGVPPRPSITPVFGMALLFWVGCATAYSWSRELDVDFCLACSVAFGIVGFVLLVASLQFRCRIVAIMLAGLLLGACLSLSCAMMLHTQANALDGISVSNCVLELLEDTRDNGFSKRALSKVVSGDSAGAAVLADFSEGHRFGQRVVGRTAFKRFSEKNVQYGWQRGAACTARIEGEHVADSAFPQGNLYAIRSLAIDAIGSNDSAHVLLQALVCGYRENMLDTKEYSAFQTCGLAHLVAVSGAHLVIVTGLFATVLKGLRFPKRLSIAILVAIMGTYLVIAGMPVSAIRATVMSALGLFAFFGRRRASSMNAIGVGIIAILSANPTASVSASFSLSALSTIGIVVFSQLFGYIVGRTPLGRENVASESVVLTVSASIASQLYASSLFFQLPLISPLANMVSAPLFPIVCSFGIASAVAQITGVPFAGAIMDAATLLARLLESLVSFLSEIPYACVPFYVETWFALLFTAVLLCALWLVWPTSIHGLKVALPFIAVVMIVANVILPANQDRIVMLNVGQGDSFLVESRGATLLVDTGNQDKMLLEELGRLRVAHLDSILVTHADDDHCGSLDVIARTVQVDRIIVAEGMPGDDDKACKQLIAQAGETARELTALSYGDAFNIGSFEAHVVWPHQFNDHGGNADSLCVRLDYDGDDDGSVDFTALFTGDAECDQLQSMIDAGDVGKIDILKVGHHGSKNGLSQSQVAEMKPSIALIGVGKDNRYGHPNGGVLEMLEDSGCTVYRSDRDGEVRCTLAPDSMKVSIVG